MNNNLPMKKQEGFWTRFKNNFLGLFSSKKPNSQNAQQPQPVQNNTLRNNNVNSNFRTEQSSAYNQKQPNNNVKNNFRTELSSAYNEKQHLYKLRRKYEQDPNFVNSMSDEEIKALTDLYNEETAEIYRKINYKKA